MSRDKNDNNRRKVAASQLRGVLLLLPLLIILTVIVYRSVSGSDAQGDNVTVADTLPAAGAAPRAGYFADDDRLAGELFDFDPNAVTYEELRRMGLAKSTAVGIVKYRTRGKRFEIPEDFATCYGITDSMYARLKPHIVIGEMFRATKFDNRSRESNSARRSGSDSHSDSRSIRTASVDSLARFNPNALSTDDFRRLGFSLRQAEAIVNYRTLIDSFRSAAEFRECFVVSDAMFERLAPYIDIPPRERPAPLLELNSADSATLVAIVGIGPRSASDIVAYRRVLGGYARMEQLKELKVITERNYTMICKQIWVDSCKIQKIDINFASPKSMAEHPYMTPQRLRKILKNRQLRGGWRTIEDMIQDNTLTREEAARLSAYLLFTDKDR